MDVQLVLAPVEGLHGLEEGVFVVGEEGCELV